MTIEIRLKSGRIVRITLPADIAVSSEQLGIMMRWAIEGKSAEVMHE
jgi:hypothetical protein